MSNITFSLRKRGTSPFKAPTAFQLRALVLDYLCHHCYTDTARAFIQDSTVKELDADGDEILCGTESSRWPSSSTEAPELLLKQVQQRREIRELILAGEVGVAIDRLTEHFPSVLSESSPSSSSPPSSHPEKTTSSTSSGDVGFTYVSETSMEPAHLLLNLRILAFIESCRTRPLETPPPKISSWSRSTSTTFPVPMDTSEHSSSSSSTLPTVHSEINPELLVTLLGKGQKLYALANALPNIKDRETYKKELENVGGLLAYKCPEESPVAKYMSYERREAVADQINRATLHWSGHSSISSIELLTRYTTALWKTANAFGAKARPGAILPPTAPKPPAAPATTTGTKPEELEELPVFDLKQFLESKP